MGAEAEAGHAVHAPRPPSRRQVTEGPGPGPPLPCSAPVTSPQESSGFWSSPGSSLAARPHRALSPSPQTAQGTVCFSKKSNQLISCPKVLGLLTGNPTFLASPPHCRLRTHQAWPPSTPVLCPLPRGPAFSLLCLNSPIHPSEPSSHTPTSGKISRLAFSPGKGSFSLLWARKPLCRGCLWCRRSPGGPAPQSRQE